jgi:hypothetical protein
MPGESVEGLLNKGVKLYRYAILFDNCHVFFITPSPTMCLPFCVYINILKIIFLICLNVGNFYKMWKYRILNFVGGNYVGLCSRIYLRLTTP